MARYLFRSVLLLFVLNLLVKPIWIFGIDRKVQVLLGYDSYGLYFSYLNFAVIFNILADAGITIYVQQHIASNQIVSARWLKKTIQYKLLLSVLYSVVTILVAFFLELNNHLLLGSLIVLQVLLSWLSFSRAVLSAKQQFVTSSFLSVFDKLLLIIPGIVVLYVYCGSCKGDILTFILGQIGAVLLALLLAFYWLYKELKGAVKEETAYSVNHIIRASLPLAAIVFLMFLHTRADGVLLNLLLPNGNEQTGIYASMYRFVDAAAVLSYLASGFLLSFWSKHLQSPEIIKETLDKIFRMMMAAAFFAAVIFFFYSNEIQQWFYHISNPGAAAVLKWGMLVLIPAFLIDLFGTILTANRKLSIFLMIVSVCTVLNLTLNTIYIPVWKAMAPAIIAIVTQTVFAALLIFVCYKNWNILPNRTSVLRVFLLLIVLLLIAVMLQKTQIPAAAQIAVLGIVWTIFLFLLNLFSLRWILNWRAEN